MYTIDTDKKDSEYAVHHKKHIPQSYSGQSRCTDGQRKK